MHCTGGWTGEPSKFLPPLDGHQQWNKPTSRSTAAVEAVWAWTQPQITIGFGERCGEIMKQKVCCIALLIREGSVDQPWFWTLNGDCHQGNGIEILSLKPSWIEKSWKYLSKLLDNWKKRWASLGESLYGSKERECFHAGLHPKNLELIDASCHCWCIMLQVLVRSPAGRNLGPFESSGTFNWGGKSVLYGVSFKSSELH